eukprot:GDKI01042454.1.p1 GENE.GDKI01042454.1~~GDKI01042454.1.p1  ORF type:complete len:170 (-),score=34.37 GDKI01042454.1:34-543(-)
METAAEILYNTAAFLAEQDDSCDCSPSSSLSVDECSPFANTSAFTAITPAQTTPIRAASVSFTETENAAPNDRFARGAVRATKGKETAENQTAVGRMSVRMHSFVLESSPTSGRQATQSDTIKPKNTAHTHTLSHFLWLNNYFASSLCVLSLAIAACTNTASEFPPLIA